MRILLVEAHERAADTMLRRLRQHGFSVDLACTADTADEAAVIDHHDVILLADTAAEIDAPRLCRSLRRQMVGTPILLISAATSTTAKVAALDAGADDYLIAPFDEGELLARLRGLLRRSQASEGSVLRAGGIVMDLNEHRVTLSGVPVKLTAKEFALLELLMRNPRRLLTRAAIGESVWDTASESSSNVIDVYVSSLRRKLTTDPDVPIIETVIGCGYRFVAVDSD